MNFQLRIVIFNFIGFAFVVLADTDEYLCPDGWSLTKRGFACIKMFKKWRTWPEAEQLCLEHSANLVVINGDDITYKISSLINNTFGEYWTGLNNIDQRKEFTWLRGGRPMDYINWNRREPNNYHSSNESCGTVSAHGKWNDVNCDVKIPGFFCEQNAFTEIPYCPDHWIMGKKKKSCFRIFTRWISYWNARLQCQRHMGDLIVIKNEEMNTEAKGTLAHYWASSAWIGISDHKWEGHYKWLDDTAEASYTAWGKGKPNHGSMAEDCGIIFAGGWDDKICSQNQPVFCQRPVLFRYESIPDLFSERDDFDMVTTE